MAASDDKLLDPAARMAEKEAARGLDAEAIRSGEKSAAQVAAESAAFAFSREQLRVNLAASRKLS